MSPTLSRARRPICACVPGNHHGFSPPMRINAMSNLFFHIAATETAPPSGLARKRPVPVQDTRWVTSPRIALQRLSLLLLTALLLFAGRAARADIIIKLELKDGDKISDI